MDCSHTVYFTNDAFTHKNDTLAEILQPKRPGRKTKAMVYVDEGIIDGNPNLLERIKSYFRSRDDQLDLVCEPEFILGGEPAKNDWSLVEVYGAT